MRYMVLAYVITLQRISLRVKRRFPGLQHLVDSGLMLESERKIFEIMDQKSPMSKYEASDSLLPDAPADLKFSFFVFAPNQTNIPQTN
jgi:Bestrophin, RFP-TM, chloride channel